MVRDFNIGMKNKCLVQHEETPYNINPFINAVDVDSMEDSPDLHSPRDYIEAMDDVVHTIERTVEVPVAVEGSGFVEEESCPRVAGLSQNMGPTIMYISREQRRKDLLLPPYLNRPMGGSNYCHSHLG